MAAIVEIVIVVPADTVAGVIVSQNRAGALIMRRSGFDSQTEDARNAREQVFRLIEPDNLRCKPAQGIVRDRGTSFVPGNVNALAFESGDVGDHLVKEVGRQ